MGIEIERKFLVKNAAWKQLNYTKTVYKQAYFCNSNKVSIRVRTSDEKAWIGFKSVTKNISRIEYEYEIPIDEAEHLLNQFTQGSAIIKTRYCVEIAPHIWEIDVFEGDNQGLIVAEVELNSENEHVDLPPWIGEEVSDDVRYFNSNLVSHPFSNW